MCKYFSLVHSDILSVSYMSRIYFALVPPSIGAVEEIAFSSPNQASAAFTFVNLESQTATHFCECKPNEAPQYSYNGIPQAEKAR